MTAIPESLYLRWGREGLRALPFVCPTIADGAHRTIPAIGVAVNLKFWFSDFQKASPKRVLSMQSSLRQLLLKVCVVGSVYCPEYGLSIIRIFVSAELCTGARTFIRQ